MSWWESVYSSGRVNWDPGDHDGHLPWLLSTFAVRPCRTVDLGCGTGKSAVWLAERGFDVVGIDLAPTAIREARALARRRGVKASFLRGEFPNDFPGRGNDGRLHADSFELAIERGFLQHLRPGRELGQALKRVALLLRRDAIFYSLILSREGNGRRWGIPLWSEEEIRSAMEGLFRIRHMELSVFTPGERGSMSAWLTVSSPR
jgi:SAM-dependent methyltransferase